MLLLAWTLRGKYLMKCPGGSVIISSGTVLAGPTMKGTSDLGEVNSSLLGKSEDMTFRYKKVDLPGYMLEPNEDKYPRENG
ncbi:hypothetical protein ACET3Z_006259 [Daucus carota]